MASTTITRKQQVQVQLAILDRIKYLSDLAKSNEEMGADQDASEDNENVEVLKDAYKKSIQFDEWKALPWPKRED